MTPPSDPVSGERVWLTVAKLREYLADKPAHAEIEVDFPDYGGSSIRRDEAGVLADSLTFEYDTVTIKVRPTP